VRQHVPTGPSTAIPATTGEADGTDVPRTGDDVAAGRPGAARDDAGGPVQRALAILELLGTPGGASALGVVEIARRLGRDKSQVSRVLKLLADAGFVDREAGSLRYRIGTRLFAIGATAVDQRLRDDADTAVAREAARLGERVEVCVLGAGGCMTISTAAPDSELRAVGWVGRTMPLSCTAAGRALLFDLDAAQIARLIASEGLAQGAPAAPRSLDELVARVTEEGRRGWSLARHESDRGLLAVGAPVRDAAGGVVAAVCASGPESRIDPVLDDVRAAVLRAASDLSVSVGARGARSAPHPRGPRSTTPTSSREGAS
jgi:DNA-binding IclR family transcriptional regulator